MFGFGRARRSGGEAGMGPGNGPEGGADWFRGDPLVELEGIAFSYADPWEDDGPSGAARGVADGADPATVSGQQDRTNAEPGRHPVLRDFSMTIRRGECVALLGPNGAGKTTIMRIINALEFPEAGTYRLGGTPVERAMVERRDSRFAKALHQRVGFVFQNSDTQLFCPSVEEEIAFGPLQMGVPEEEVARRVRDLADLFGLERMLRRAPYRLSGGEKKRVAIACCMSLNPDLLVLDEPTDGLDERNLDAVVDVLRAFVDAGKTVLISTHHHDVVERLGVRVVHVEPLRA